MAEAFELRGLHYVYPGGVTALAGIDLRGVYLPKYFYMKIFSYS